MAAAYSVRNSKVTTRAGDVVTTYFEPLGRWVAGQITATYPVDGRVDLLELDWSGPEPATIDAVRGAGPVSVRWEHVNANGMTPRNYRVVGSMSLLTDQPATMYTTEWAIGSGVFSAQREAAGQDSSLPGVRDEEGTLEQVITAMPERHAHALSFVHGGELTSFDCGVLAERCPHLIAVRLGGVAGGGELHNLERLNELGGLRALQIRNFLHLSLDDCPQPANLVRLEYLWLRNTPTAFADEAKRLWKPEQRNGTFVDISLVRSPEWITANADNPFRDWDDRELIGTRQMKKALTIYRDTRRHVLRALEQTTNDDTLIERCAELGRDYAEQFNKLNARNAWIETMERDEIMTALGTMLDGHDGPRQGIAQATLEENADEHRDW